MHRREVKSYRRPRLLLLSFANMTCIVFLLNVEDLTPFSTLINVAFRTVNI